jgi:hypothetical protein
MVLFLGASKRSFGAMAIPNIDGPGPHGGEVHPDGDEFLYVVSGTMELILDDGDERAVGVETKVLVRSGDERHRAGVIRVILSSTVSGDSLEEAVEEGFAVGLVVVVGVVALAEDDGHELGSGLEVGAGLARGFHSAFELDGPGAESVAEHAGVGFASEARHGGGLDLGG